MKLVYPDFYRRFKCIGSKCVHNCCIGWEIDIDDDTYKKYRSADNRLTERFKSCISCEDETHFILDENERCPFLNRDNLCDIILEMGEDSLCQICTDHPRFRNFFGDRTEIGLGLCCEEAVRLLLETDKPLSFIESESDGKTSPLSGTEKWILEKRGELISILQNRTKPISTRAREMLRSCETSPEIFPPQKLAEIYLPLERLDNNWTLLLRRLESASFDEALLRSVLSQREYEYEHFIVYWLFRHFSEVNCSEDIAPAVRLAYLSFIMISSLDALYFSENGATPRKQRAEHIRMYSSEIEYSQENLEALYSYLY